MKTINFALFFFVVIFSLNAQEFHMPQPSPATKVHQNFSTSFIEIEYSRPSVNGRNIFGELIPFDEVWRTGANQTSKITFGEPVNFSGKAVEAGTYALYTIPGKEEWTIILNRGVDNWGAAGFDETQNIAEVKVPVEKLDFTQESMLIMIENLTKDSGDLVLQWDDAKVSIPLKTDNNERILAHLEKALKSDKPPYTQAASYYLATDQNLEEGLKYIQKSIEASPETYYLYWIEAQLLEKLGKNEAAIKSAKKAADITKDDHPAFEYEYRRNYEKLKERVGG